MGDVFARFGQFIEEVRYVPNGQPLPEGFTHALKLTNAAGDRDVVVALRFQAQVVPLVDLVLSFV